MSQGNKAARNERRKISATFANTLAASLIVTAAVVPSVAATYGAAFPAARFWGILMAAWIILGFGLHLVARRLLARIEE